MNSWGSRMVYLVDSALREARLPPGSGSGQGWVVGVTSLIFELFILLNGANQMIPLEMSNVKSKTMFFCFNVKQ